MSYNLSKLSDQELENKLNLVEKLLLTENDYKKLPPLNRSFQLLLDEQVRRDLTHEPKFS